MTLACFKAYDIRGRLGSELNTDIAYRIGRAFGQYLKAKTVAIGGDIRLSSKDLKASLANGLMDAGVDVIDLGMTGTEEIYFAAFHLDVDGAIEVTASHNPMDYNGMKLVGRGAKPISGDSGLNDIRDLADSGQFEKSERRGSYNELSLLNEYVDHLLSYIDIKKIKPLKLVVNAGNGAAGHVVDEIEARFQQMQVPVEFIKVHHEPDGHFPNGIPNPLLPENRTATSDAVKLHQADMGIAWDGDFDRCFLFDENGEFIEGYYIVGLLAEAFLSKNPGSKIIHDPRLTWNTIEIVQNAGGIPVQSKTGHAFIKERMRAENAIYGGEMSAHHYFREFAYCDSGMIPWLLVAELLSAKNVTLSNALGERMDLFPCSGEINYRVENPKDILIKIKDVYQDKADNINYIDGVSIECADFRLNVRISNTEPLLRLNVETKGSHELLHAEVKKLDELIKH
ncbi:phosphomannomutase CpsG [Dickeya chrysanthemi]|uniref:phosphomannomutase CpsG n=1 Tax=Dickeya chrysanthemi TaxID=556 RepID=UPI0030192B4B